MIATHFLALEDRVLGGRFGLRMGLRIRRLYVYACMNICLFFTCAYIYIWICVKREKEKERETELVFSLYQARYLEVSLHLL